MTNTEETKVTNEELLKHLKCIERTNMLVLNSCASLFEFILEKGEFFGGLSDDAEKAFVEGSIVLNMGCDELSKMSRTEELIPNTSGIKVLEFPVDKFEEFIRNMLK